MGTHVSRQTVKNKIYVLKFPLISHTSDLIKLEPLLNRKKRNPVPEELDTNGMEPAGDGGGKNSRTESVLLQCMRLYWS